jgi:hypothetical protein
MQDQTKAILDFMTVFIINIPNEVHRNQLDYALEKTRAQIEGDEDGGRQLVPPHIPKHIS